MMDVVAAGLDQLHERVSGRFSRSEPRARVREYEGYSEDRDVM